MGKRLLFIVAILITGTITIVFFTTHEPTYKQGINDASFHTSSLKEKSNLDFDYISASVNPIKGRDEESMEDMVDGMSIKEKVGQMIISGITGTSFNDTIKSLIDQYKVGGLIFYEDSMKQPKQTVDLLNEVKSANAKNQFPLFLTIDQEGGRISKLPGDLRKLPVNEAIGKVKDGHFSYQIGELLGEQVKAFGLNLNYAPVLDVNSNPDNPIIGDRSFGSNPGLVSELGIQTMKGIQSKNTISVVKHFPGHGDTSSDSHVELPTVDKTRKQLEKLEFVPFKRAIEEGADAMMVAHILLPKVDPNYPATLSSTIISDILREQLGFKGVVMTDDMTMKAITNHYEIGQAAIKAVQAGNDIIMVAHDYQKVVTVINAILEAVESGEISEETINKSVKRIINMKNKYELDSEAVKELDISKLNQSIEKVIQ